FLSSASSAYEKGRRRQAPRVTIAQRSARLGRDLLGIARRLVAEVRPEPPLDLGERHALADRIVLDLVAAHASDREEARLRMSEIDPAHARPGDHRARLRQRDTGVLGAQQ